MTVGASPALTSRLRFSSASLKGMVVSSNLTLVRFSISVKNVHESLTGTSGHSVHSSERVNASVAVNCMSAPKSSIAPFDCSSMSTSLSPSSPHAASASALEAAMEAPMIPRRVALRGCCPNTPDMSFLLGGLFLRRPVVRSNVCDHTTTSIETFGAVIDNFQILTTRNSDVNESIRATPKAP